MSVRLEAAFQEFCTKLFHDVPENFSERYVTRTDYVTVKKEVEEKYNLCEGDPEYLEWILLLIGRSPRFLDSSKERPKQRLMVAKKFHPHYTKQFIELLDDHDFLKNCGEIVLGILNSDRFWKGLQRRLDFYVYQHIMHESNSKLTIERLSPREKDAISADAHFCLVEMEVLKFLRHPIEIIYDELFRQFVFLIDEGMEEESCFKYSFFVAPFFNTNTYGCNLGQMWLEQLTEDVFRKELIFLNGQLRERL